jgi:prefoldin subunit 5
MSTKELVKPKTEFYKSPTFNLLNVAPVKFVSDTNIIKSTDREVKEAKLKYNAIIKTIEFIDFMKSNSIFDTSYFGETSRYNPERYSFENSIGRRIFGKITPNLVRDIDSYNSNIQTLATRNHQMPKDIKFISYAKTMYNQNKDNEFSYPYWDIKDYTDVLNSRIFSNTSDLTKLADIFGFVIMPLALAKETIYSCDPFRDSRTIKEAVKEYKKFNEKKELYVLCPLDFYDLMTHAKAEKYYQVYFPKSLPHLGMNIGMSLPVFRTLFESVGMLDKRVTELENNVENIKKQLVSIEKNITILQSEVNKLAQTQVNLRMEMIAQNEKFKAYKLEMQQQIARMIDPLLFSVDKSIEDFDISVPCQLGFAWGAEFPEEFINMLGVNATNNFKNIWLK